MAELVLQAPALLYEIFLHLSQQDLLLIQCVCRTWQNIITTSTSLQAKLFFHPGTRRSNTSQVPELNPLLQDRFPSFFDGGRHENRIKTELQNLGPWNSTDWFRGKSRAKIPRLSSQDRRRMAAYARAEASWRRMIPCKPAPDELQVAFGYEGRRSFSGTLKCLKFLNQKEENVEENDGNSMGDTTLSLTWLTFGTLYDIVEQAWFRESTIRISYVMFDYSFKDPESQEQDPPMVINDLSTRLRKSLRHKKIGGPGRVLVFLNNAEWCGTDDVSPPNSSKPKVRMYKEEFRSTGSIAKDIEWLEELDF
jgi:hypothetical protein